MNCPMCHRPNYTHLLLREPLPTTSSALRTVDEYIEANRDQPIDIQVKSTVTNGELPSESLKKSAKRLIRDRDATPVARIRSQAKCKSPPVLADRDQQKS
jgi:hypothetical protein